MNASVKSLLSAPFLNRPRNQQIEIVRRGRPRPDLPYLQTTVSEHSRRSALKGKVVNRTITFDAALYDKVEWLAGCEVEQTLFCWYCLLFRSCQLTSANYIQITVTADDLIHLDRTIANHAKCAVHLQCALNFCIFLEEVGVGDLAAAGTTDDLNKNHELARRIIDVVCFTISEINPGTEYRERSQRLVNDCIQNLQLYRDYDFMNTGIIDEATAMLQANFRIIGDMAGTIKTVIIHSIEKELQQSTYVSMILSEHSRRERKSQISIVLRYLKDGNVCERFVGFYNTKLQKKSTSLIREYIKKAMDDFKISTKIIAISLDAAVLASEQQDALETEMLKTYPHLLFMPTYFHKLGSGLMESLSFINELDVFFKKITLMKKVFRKGSDVREEFQKCFSSIEENKRKETVENLELCMSDFTMSAHYFEALKTHRTTFVTFLKRILNLNQNKLAAGAPEVRALYDFLKSVRTFFVLEIMTKFIGIVQPLIELIENQISSPLLDRKVELSVYRSLQNEGKINNARGEISFEAFWNNIFEMLKEAEDTIECKNLAAELGKKPFYRKLYWDIQKCIATKVWDRIHYSQTLAFLGMMNFKEKYSQLNSMPQLKSAYRRRNFFNFKLLADEIKALQNEEALSTCESAFQVMDILSKFNLKQRFPNVYRLGELVSTMPCCSPNPEGIPHKWNTVNGWCYDCDLSALDPDDTFSITCIERDYLEQIRQNDTFFGEVMDRFDEKNACLMPR